MALIPLSLWFLYVMLGLSGTNEVAAVSFWPIPGTRILMGAFVGFSLWHAYLGLQVVIDDYIHTPGMKIFLMLVVRFSVIAICATSLVAIVRITAL